MTINLKDQIKNSAFAFRGYNVTNLGRTHELLTHDKFGPIVASHLQEASEICSDAIGRKVDLVDRVERQEETKLEDYAEAISLIVAVEQAQIQCLRDIFEIEYESAKFAFGFSLGEISSLVAGKVYSMKDALSIPLAMSDDGIELARDVTLGVLFSRGEILPLEKIDRALLEVNQLGIGVVGISTILSPNSVLVLGTGETIDVLRKKLKKEFPKGLHLRRNENKWPPLHTSIVWNKNIPNRSACLMHTLSGGLTEPTLPILSLVTGKKSYTATNSREIIRKWIDQPQLLWDAVCETLSSSVDTVIHLGPAPNIIPATFERLADNIEAQTRGSRRMRALAAVIRRPWLQNLLPKRASLLRASMVQHVIAEDWMLEQNV